MTEQVLKRIRESVNYWYLPLIVGIIFIATGIWTFSSPTDAYLGLSIVFSIAFLTTGILECIFAISNREELDNWGWTLVLGLMTAVVGGLLLAHPEVSMISMPLYVGFMIMFRSFGAMGIALDLKSNGVLEWGTLMVLGVLGLIFSFILIWNPLFAGMTIVFWTGISLLLAGAFNAYLAFKMKKLNKNWDELSEELKQKYAQVKFEIQKAMKETGE